MDKLDPHTQEKTEEILKELKKLEQQFDTRLLATLLASRAGVLFGAVIGGGLLSQEDVRLIWKTAGEPINNPPKTAKIVTLYDGMKIDPLQIN